MTTIYSNNTLLETRSITHVNNVAYTFCTTKIVSAQMVDRVYGVFVSDVIQASSNFIKWRDLTWAGQTNINAKTFFFVRSAAAAEDLEKATWVGPFSNGTNDISTLTEPYLQFMIVLRNDADKTTILPIVEWVNVSFFSAQNAVRFFTKTFYVGFSPKHILLTYRATNVTDDTIIRFAVGSEDTADLAQFQYINPDKIETLNEVSYAGNGLKLMLELVGTSAAQVYVDEFAFMIGGDGVRNLNELSTSSSSSESNLSSSSLSSFHGIGYWMVGINFVVD